jgi:uncharacterized protein (TIGR00297 family)
MDFGLRILIGAVAAAVVAIIARRAGSLSVSGAVAAALIGTAAVAAGWSWGALLILYFLSSSLLSRLGRARKLEHTAGMVEKAGARDATQVMANGLVFAVLSIASVLTDDAVGFVAAGAAASLAASAADTWATEIGTWAGHTPRSILTGRKLAVGQSGGVTAAGLFASVAGASFVAAAAVSLGWPSRLVPAIVAGGLMGSLADSFVGALLQRRSWCDACAQVTEMEVHVCGVSTRRTGGLAIVDNDAVNLLATLIGATIAMLFLTPGIRD